VGRRWRWVKNVERREEDVWVESVRRGGRRVREVRVAREGTGAGRIVGEEGQGEEETKLARNVGRVVEVTGKKG
jgi:hypothetical protein